jgi:predicted GNAT family N-acyltransferase
MIAEQGDLTDAQWEELQAGEDDPFGVGDLDMQWQPKERYLVLSGPDGRLRAAAGLVEVDVEAGGETFPVAGVGGVIVAHPYRGQGLARQVVEAAVARAETLGPERAMLFCAPHNIALYARFGFIEIAAPVFAQQPQGEIEMPPAAMWRPLREGAGWPDGPVRLAGRPF